MLNLPDPELLADTYRYASPYPHLVLDNVAEQRDLYYAAAKWPSDGFKRYQGGKSGAVDRDQLSHIILSFLHYGNSAHFLFWLEHLTGIDNLVADPEFQGSGLHENRRDALLGIHVDFNALKAEQLYRRLNVFLFVNDGWKDDWGGNLELWENAVGKDGNNYPNYGGSHVRIFPGWNRLVICESSERSWHGHPFPLRCPKHRSRRSFAWYFFSREKPKGFREVHSTIYRAAPWHPGGPSRKGWWNQLEGWKSWREPKPYKQAHSTIHLK